MSLEWKTVELKSIANVTMGQSPKSEFYNDNFEGMPFLQGNKTFGDKYPSFELYTTSIKKVAEKNSVLMSVRAPVGDLNIAQEDICIGRGVCGLQMKKGNNEFLYYLLKANISHLINKESGTVFGSINKNDIETFEVTLPKSSDDQMKILTILKNIDKKIDICKNLNRNLQNLIKILYKEYFESFELNNVPDDWELVNIGSIIDIYNGYSYKGTELQESDCGMVTIKNFNRDGSFRIDGFKEIVYSNKIKKHHFINENDVLISCTDVTQDADIIGNCIIVLDKQNYDELIMSMDLVRIESKIPEINNFFRDLNFFGENSP
ncbi:restriction endonuclease subunit S [uncultured Methanobrevibacter sp.]|uniref:restriction endonuclease subunit S n=1 Tax=uncultured Methanobrevibacter sp. TaxID=253161 RepID=UPI0025FDA920|nr:restriction endonuclease subunit S [uncultured Methanobrevibacter sp.]